MELKGSGSIDCSLKEDGKEVYEVIYSLEAEPKGSGSGNCALETDPVIVPRKWNQKEADLVTHLRNQK